MRTIQLHTLKDIDKKILRNLIEDGQQPFSEIAGKLNTTRQNVSQKIKKLKEKNLITSFTIELNNHLIEELKVKAYVLFREDTNPEIREENEKKLKDIPQITRVSRLFGNYDVIVELYGRDNNEITEIINQIHTLRGISGTETFIVHTIIKNDEKAPILNLLSV
ncbi:MAG: Lrp/AsnC family transcriptional regulator [Candidatus Helarchaeota archaeon]|nr:Lrp/AsnC family transcriptional regulator [Candidatus Helarchaeota archaeon]